MLCFFLAGCAGLRFNRGWRNAPLFAFDEPIEQVVDSGGRYRRARWPL
jgi:glutaredoxin 3